MAQRQAELLAAYAAAGSERMFDPVFHGMFHEMFCTVGSGVGAGRAASILVLTTC